MNLRIKLGLSSTLCILFASVALAALPPGYNGKIYGGDTLLGKPQGIPGVIKGMFVDSGGEGSSWHSCCALQGYAGYDYDIIGWGTNGQNDSSVNATHPTSHLSYMVAGQWMKYTVHVNIKGTYYVDFKLATVGYPNLQVLTYYDGASMKSDSVQNLPVCQTPPGCPEPWHAWNCNMAVDSVDLDTGLQVVGITFAQGSWNYDWTRFRLKEEAGTQVSGGSMHSAGPAGLATRLTGNRLAIGYKGGTSCSRISVVDCTGRTMLSSIDANTANGYHSACLDISKLRQGIYFVNVERKESKETTSVTVTR
ncbi:MAG TPA: T9SS type A sorting domain-containing protein [Chitinivibrionales bacterium]|nr:T9SS type A sorting domain-containing protein [Chitinivibrionales bacterium]